MSKFKNWKPTGKTIGQGGQGQIILVKDKKNHPDETFALKKLNNTNRINRFIDEIKASFSLDHPNIIKIIDYDYKGDNPFIVMKYYEKGSLNKINLKIFSLNDKLEIFRKICEAIAFAHKNNPPIIHRDLKPENIFLDDNNNPIIGDFGLCFIDDDGERLTLTDEAVGSVHYMAPELEDGIIEKINPSSDVYSLGKILYWLLMGDIFSREKHRKIQFNISNKFPDRESSLINGLLDKMIINNSEDRFNNAQEVLNEFEIMINRINRGHNEIGGNIIQTCIFCGKGTYTQLVNESPNDGNNYVGTKNFGFTAVGAPTWIIKVCDFCGNVQIFRPEYSDNKEH